MQASKIAPTASIWAVKGLLESRWSLVAAVKILSRVLDMTDTDALCSLAIINGNQEQGLGVYVVELWTLKVMEIEWASLVIKERVTKAMAKLQWHEVNRLLHMDERNRTVSKAVYSTLLGPGIFRKMIEHDYTSAVTAMTNFAQGDTPELPVSRNLQKFFLSP